LTVWPPAAEVWRVPQLISALTSELRPGCGLVRALYFDKPPAQSWALPWHKDLTVAVRDNRLPSGRFGKPTRKAGVPHAEAPLEVLDGMLTARLHLDPVDGENGPLKVIPGSHRAGKALALDTAPPRALHAARGDVLLMRPQLAHCSGKSAPGSGRHRRVLHLEFAARCDLPDGFAWHDFLPVAGATPAAA
jgi:ectoine hydroxylase-related dioxygenase (phytanoyl-CoA dioxygenase family)